MKAIYWYISTLLFVHRDLMEALDLKAHVDHKDLE